jgi:hypothetical protein
MFARMMWQAGLKSQLPGASEGPGSGKPSGLFPVLFMTDAETMPEQFPSG